MTQAPAIGDIVYIDDVDQCHKTFIIGGQATVENVWFHNRDAWISVAEVEGTAWNWTGYLSQDQVRIQSCRPGPAGQLMIQVHDGSIVPFMADDDSE